MALEPIQKILLGSVILFFVLIFIIVLLVNNLGKKSKESVGYRSNYPSSYLCNDGHRVRSLSELHIDDFFFKHGIPHEYEDVIIKTVNSAEKQYKYDWYFPESDLYVEFFGFSGKKYKENTEDKIKFYRVHGLKMVALDPSVLANVNENIPEKFGKQWVKLINPRHCPNCGGALDKRV